jgi:MATE family multidrug resistance protein
MNSLPTVLKDRWNSAGGYRELLGIALPLILSTSTWSIQHFVDRMFLTWYSTEAIAAAMPSGILNFMIMTLFIGTASYINTFVAQYFGAKQFKKIGPIVWQGIYVAIFGGIVHLLLIPFARLIFNFFNHAPEIKSLEIVYFQILCLGAFPAIASSAFSSFFSGRGKTWPLLWVNFTATFTNIIFDYLLIFGHFGFPEMGIKGAAIATVMSACVSFVIYLIIVMRPAFFTKFCTVHSRKFDLHLLRQLIHFGLPNGIQFFLDVAGITAFLMLIGQLGRDSLAATNITFNINNLAFMPMIGFGITVSVMVGQYLGKDQPALAQKSVYSGFHITIIYMSLMAMLYLTYPDIFIRPFTAGSTGNEMESIRKTVVVLLKFVALYSIFDTLNIIFAAAIKGAGDTRFVMWLLSILSVTILIIPTYLALIVWEKSIFVGWAIITIYIICLGSAFFLRFLGGRWKNMRVIEKPIPGLPSTFVETPTPDI